MKKLLSAAVALAILAVPAFAQQKGEEPLQAQDRDKKMQAERLDQQYKRTMEQTRKTETVRTDPWAAMRAPKEEKR